MTFMRHLKGLYLITLPLVALGCSNTGEGLKKDADLNGEKASQMAREGMKSTEEVRKDAVAAASLTPAIKVALTAEPSLNDEGNLIDVDTSEERGVLNGHVKSVALRQLAESVARRVLQDRKERQRLENRLEVKA